MLDPPSPPAIDCVLAVLSVLYFCCKNMLCAWPPSPAFWRLWPLFEDYPAFSSSV